MTKILASAFLVLIMPIVASDWLSAQAQTVSILIVRHPETVPEGPPARPLTTVGQQRADLLIHTLRGVKFTHFFASHTTRSRQAIEKIAAAHGLSVVQLPKPGSLLDGKIVTDDTSRRAPIEPISEALLQLPAGSVALVGLNSENIYAILNRLGVPEAPAGQSCDPGSMCVPCTSNECYPGKEFDHLWHVVRQPGRAEPLASIELRYGAGWQAPKN
jgi:hypothetical protein